VAASRGLAPASIPGFDVRSVETSRGAVHTQSGGDRGGVAVVLLHGFPETGLMWRDVAPAIATSGPVVVPDLPGYGQSSVPSDGDMSKRALAATVCELMASLGHDRFAIVGHDRGGRVAYRLALDHPESIVAIAVLDVIPTADVWDRVTDEVMLSFWPFTLLAQPAPLPEALLAAAPDAVVDAALGGWGSPPSAFPVWVRDAYVDALRDPAHISAICDEYRAAAGVDREHDLADLGAGNRITAPLLALWSAHGGLAHWYEDEGGPTGIWRRWAGDVTGRPVDGGHFFPEEHPELTSSLLLRFLGESAA
jgi:haloacetate dehalogenase